MRCQTPLSLSCPAPQYLNAISSNRWLALKILGVVLVFMVFFILFIA